MLPTAACDRSSGHSVTLDATCTWHKRSGTKLEERHGRDGHYCGVLVAQVLDPLQHNNASPPDSAATTVVNDGIF